MGFSADVLIYTWTDENVLICECVLVCKPVYLGYLSMQQTIFTSFQNESYKGNL